jgi:excisionase family DNA binding protein
MAIENIPLCVSRAAAARLLGVGLSSLKELLARRELVELRVGRRSLVPLSEIDRFVRERVAAATIPAEDAR